MNEIWTDNIESINQFSINPKCKCNNEDIKKMMYNDVSYCSKHKIYSFYCFVCNEPLSFSVINENEISEEIKNHNMEKINNITVPNKYLITAKEAKLTYNNNKEESTRERVKLQFIKTVKEIIEKIHKAALNGQNKIEIKDFIWYYPTGETELFQDIASTEFDLELYIKNLGYTINEYTVGFEQDSSEWYTIEW